MTSLEKRLRRNVTHDELLDRELVFVPKNVSRDDIREIGRRYGPRRKRSSVVRMILGLVDFVACYCSPFLGLLVGAEYAAARALYPLVGEQKEFGDSLRLFLGDTLTRHVEDMSKAFEIAGALLAATPKIVSAALYGALAGIIFYVIAKRLLIGAAALRRSLALRRKVRALLG
jgi:hypothetical protein